MILRAAEFGAEEWQPVAFNEAAGWRNFGNGWDTVQFRRRPLTREVDLKGAMLGDNKSEGVIVFVLPEGYRPPYAVQMAIARITTDVADEPRVRIRANGEVLIWGMSGTTTSTVTLDGVSFIYA